MTRAKMIVSLPQELADAARQMSEKTGIPVSVIVQRALAYWVRTGTQPPLSEEGEDWQAYLATQEKVQEQVDALKIEFEKLLKAVDKKLDIQTDQPDHLAQPAASPKAKTTRKPKAPKTK